MHKHKHDHSDVFRLAERRPHHHIRAILKLTLEELRHHVPFTALGSFIAILIVLVVIIFGELERVESVAWPVFYVLHPAHLFLGAIVTTSMYLRHGKKKIWVAMIIGFVGSLFIGTLSDSIIPYGAEWLLGLPHSEAHIGFIEEPLLTLPMAALGVGLGIFLNATKFPHMGHIMISTFASLFHMIMAFGDSVPYLELFLMLIFLFVAVWVPCCFSDIVFPLLFANKPRSVDKCEVCNVKRAGDVEKDGPKIGHP